MIKILDKSQCCGCTACVNICPKGCIEMIEDKEGFVYPEVYGKECINCGLCIKTCPIINETDCSDTTIAVVSYSNNEDVRLQSSSGGLFSVIAEYIIENGGVVFGAVFDSQFHVRHVCVDKMEDLHILRGSKYVQSDLNGIFKEVKECILKGKTVLFSGTECQIEGLKKYLGKLDNELLYTIDVLCHGVPSDKLWIKYLKWQEKKHGASVQRIFCRHKTNGWKKYAMLLEFSNNIAYERIISEDPFMQMFLGNICLRPSCYQCKFKNINRASDITLGDCWGIEKHSPELDDDKGTSVVLIHSEKGVQLYDAVKAQTTYKTIDIEDAIPRDAESLNSAISHMNRSKFFKAFQRGEDIPELVSLLKISLSQRIFRKLKKVIKELKEKDDSNH